MSLRLEARRRAAAHGFAKSRCSGNYEETLQLCRYDRQKRGEGMFSCKLLAGPGLNGQDHAGRGLHAVPQQLPWSTRVHGGV